LQNRLTRAQLVIEVQKKLSEMLDVPLPPMSEPGEDAS